MTGNTYFSLFGIPLSYSISLSALNTSYTTLIAKHHPDNFTDDSVKMTKALEHTAYINTAYKTLSDPVLRGVYMLEFHNIDAFDEYDTQMSSEFLMNQIELQETLERLTDEEELTDFLATINSKITHYITNIASTYEQAEYELMRNLVRELKFYIQLQDTINTKLDTII